MSGARRTVDAHYGSAGLAERILAAVRQAGGDTDAPTLDDLGPFEHFHTRGRDATQELAERVGLAPGTAVLDVGCGTGGPARLLAARYGVCVVGLDLTEEFVRAGSELTRRVGLADRVVLCRGDALSLPFSGARFDVVWTQHAAMNIADKARLYGQMHRVLRPGGRLALHDIVAGPRRGFHFPVPWAGDASISFLVRPDDLRAMLGDAGFRPAHWADRAEDTLAWIREQRRRRRESPAPIVDPVRGPEFPLMFDNLLRNLEEGHAGVIEAVLERAD